MVKTCIAPGCFNNQNCKNLKFYRIPTEISRKNRWIAAIKHKNWEPPKSSRLCSEHFINGRKSDDLYSPDYVPSIFNRTSKQKITSQENSISKQNTPLLKVVKLENIVDLKQNKCIQKNREDISIHHDATSGLLGSNHHFQKRKGKIAIKVVKVNERKPIKKKEVLMHLRANTNPLDENLDLDELERKITIDNAVEASGRKKIKKEKEKGPSYGPLKPGCEQNQFVYFPDDDALTAKDSRTNLTIHPVQSTQISKRDSLINDCVPLEVTCEVDPFEVVHSDGTAGDKTCSKRCKTIGIGTDLTSCRIDAIMELNQSLIRENLILKSKLKHNSFSLESFEGNDSKVKYLTGLKSFSALTEIYEFLSSILKEKNKKALNSFQQILLVLLKVNHNLSLQFLGYMFGFHCSTISRAISDVLDIVHKNSDQPLIKKHLQKVLLFKYNITEINENTT